MAIPLIPWEPHVFPKEIQTELRRRAINRGFNPVNGANTTWAHNTDDGGEWNAYRGPMTSWIRVCSNGAGLETRRPLMEGFVFYGGKDFYTSYGINRGVSRSSNPESPNQTILGYTPEGVAHVIENDLVNSRFPINVPNPEIDKISAVIQKELMRRVRIEWTCFSFKQLEYMTPYFLVPGISVIVEWGWNHFNPMSLLKLDDSSKLADLYNNPYPLYTDNILASKGNYEVLFGIVTNFEWSIDGNKIKCVTEVTSKDRIWAGQVISSNMIEKDEAMGGNAEDSKKDPPIKIIDSLKKFVGSYIDKFKDLIDQTKTADAIINSYLNNPTSDKQPIQAFVQYVKNTHPDNYKEYLFGLFFGRDEQTRVQYSHGGGFFTSQTRTVKEIADDYANKEFDFDCQSPRENLWLNMGLVVELINFFSSQLKGVKDQPMFRVDVDDCVISAHPNLISTNGDILLIPNALAPKYFAGIFGNRPETEIVGEYQDKMAATTILRPIPKAADLDPKDISVSLKWADYRLHKITKPMGGVKRDDLNNIINFNRKHFSTPQGDFEFPFAGDYFVEEGEELRTYDAFYTGLFKNLYLNSRQLKDILEDESVVTFKHVYDQIFQRINSAASEFWSFKLVGSTGRLNTQTLATMKIVDDKLAQYTSNDGEIFTFDYFSADGLLQAINFRPMLSNAQAIRTIYAQTNLTNKKSVVLSDHNELLDYKFRDRLFKVNDQTSNTANAETFRDSSFISSMERLQALRPPDKSFQVTTKNQSKQKTIFRLAIPPDHADILTLLLDDNDKLHNPRYTGIMPGIQAEFTIQGIAGIRTFAMFRVRGLPEPYSEENIIFRVINVNDTVQNGQWTTNIVAGVMPLRGYFRSKLGLSIKELKSDV
jgi:hypothetical protein